jgi:pyruvate dehydrogenase E2 component (dihydrolipoamide acetyltransferase)
VPAPVEKVIQLPVVANVAVNQTSNTSHASPSVRKYARELGAEISKVKGSGPKSRITQEDVQSYIKGILSGQSAAQTTQTSSGNGLQLLPWPKID